MPSRGLFCIVSKRNIIYETPGRENFQSADDLRFGNHTGGFAVYPVRHRRILFDADRRRDYNKCGVICRNLSQPGVPAQGAVIRCPASREEKRNIYVQNVHSQKLS